MRFFPIAIALSSLILVACSPTETESADTSTPPAPALDGGVEPEESLSSAEPAKEASENNPAANPEAVTTSEKSAAPTASQGAASAPGGMTVPLYPGATKPAEADDKPETQGAETITVLTRTTKDDFAKVQTFYKSKAKWTSTTELDDLAIYEIEKGGVREIVGIQTDEGTTTITITKIEKA